MAGTQNAIVPNLNFFSKIDVHLRSLPELALLDIRPPPKVKIVADGVACYHAETDDLVSPFSALSAQLSLEMPLLTKGHVMEDSRSGQ